jgi:hypothetical protein
MGQVQRRKQARGFGKTSTTPKSSIPLKVFSKTVHELSQIEDVEFQQARKNSPNLALLWFAIVTFHNLIDHLTPLEVIEFWTSYWKDAVNVLGQIELGAPQHQYWLGRIKGMSLMISTKLHNSFNKKDMQYILENVETSFISMGETTIEIGLAMSFHADCIIYAGKSLLVYRGCNTIDEQGEVMIAVKHISGCWSHYPFQNTLSVPFSDYKQAKLALKNFPISLKGELVHFNARRLAKLLGLIVYGNYAYLIK